MSDTLTVVFCLIRRGFLEEDRVSVRGERSGRSGREFQAGKRRMLNGAYDPAIPHLLGIYTTEMKTCSYKNWYTNVHSIVIQNSQKRKNPNFYQLMNKDILRKLPSPITFKSTQT